MCGIERITPTLASIIINGWHVQELSVVNFIAFYEYISILYPKDIPHFCAHSFQQWLVTRLMHIECDIDLRSSEKYLLMKLERCFPNS